jgi:hypothetical protein
MPFCLFIGLVSYSFVIAGANLDSSIALCVVIYYYYVYDNSPLLSHSDSTNHYSIATFCLDDDIVALSSRIIILSAHAHLQQCAHFCMSVVGLYRFQCFMSL